MTMKIRLNYLAARHFTISCSFFQIDHDLENSHVRANKAITHVLYKNFDQFIICDEGNMVVW